MKRITCLARLRESFKDKTNDELSALVICKNVYIDGELVTEPKQLINPNSSVDVIYPKYVSRGGYKLEKALEDFGVDVKGKVVVDAGSSTGGFTHCLLQKGASKVYSVDVGYNLLDYRLRSDSRVVVCEKTNVMEFDQNCDFAVADLSFRSINGAASHLLSLCSEKKLVALIKPQFELKGQVDEFDGVVKSPSLLFDICIAVHQQLLQENLGVHRLCQSPIKGRKGNTEFLFLIKDGKGMDEQSFIQALKVLPAFDQLKL